MSRHLLRQQNDLSYMLLNMSNNLVDSIQHADIATLRRNPLYQPL